MNASIINTGGNTKIFSTNNVNKIEVSTENIIQSDSDSREVVKKGYLLSQINLTTIPDIIQDAINEAMLDIKEQTLADALIETLRLSISNLDDGVYKKTYIDNTISYIENLVVSKVSPETVAAIADSKLAIALEGFATTSSVSILSSRVENSEVEISNVKQTINTKDAARALQFEQMEARVNDTFAGYSEAVELYVDAQGNVKSQKIETLTTNIGLQLEEINQLIVDTDNNWNAKSVKLITAPSGAITGYSFQDGSGLKSNFDINADNFKISNSYNTYSPFSIVGTSLYFNGKISFTNTTNVPDFALNSSVDSKINNLTKVESIPWQQEVQNAINNNATYIDGKKIVTNQALVNNLNATGGIIAETVTANEFVGKTFTGAVINGAVINGAVVKASYLDLDGELEVLTNYHITPAMYNANPSLYTDAVYMSGTNEWRIPSISAIFSDNILKSGNSANVGTTISCVSNIKPYNNANSGHNIKCVKSSPAFVFNAELGREICNMQSNSSLGVQTFTFSIGSILILKVIANTDGSLNHTATISGAVGNYTITAHGGIYDNTTAYTSITVMYNGLSFLVSIGAGRYSIKLSADTYTSSNTYTSDDIRISATSSSFYFAPYNQTIYSLSKLYLPKISVNNMI